MNQGPGRYGHGFAGYLRARNRISHEGVCRGDENLTHLDADQIPILKKA